MEESFLERFFAVFVEGPGAILKARFGGDNAGRPHRSAPFGGWGWGDASRATVVGLGLLLRLKGRAV